MWIHTEKCVTINYKCIAKTIFISGGDMETQLTLRIPQRLARQLDSLVRKKRKPRSSIVREAIEAYFQRETGRHKDHPFDRVQDLIGSVAGGPPDLGARHREYLQELFHGRR
jgi:Arc/MetJ-type ribon-helix-helix transcriptional regulator